MNNMERERFRMLMMKALDGELAGSEYSEFENFLRLSEENRSEWNSYKKLKDTTRSLRLKEPDPEVWDNYWSKIVNRFERGVAWLLVTVGAVLLLTYAAFEAANALWINTEIPLGVKIGIVALMGGLLLLFVSVIREKWFVRKHDKYKEVVR